MLGEVRVLRDASVDFFSASGDGGEHALGPRLTAGRGATVPRLRVSGGEDVVGGEIDAGRVRLCHVPVDLVGQRVACRLGESCPGAGEEWRPHKYDGQC